MEFSKLMIIGVPCSSVHLAVPVLRPAHGMSGGGNPLVATDPSDDPGLLVRLGSVQTSREHSRVLLPVVAGQPPSFALPVPSGVMA